MREYTSIVWRKGLGLKSPRLSKTVVAVFLNIHGHFPTQNSARIGPTLHVSESQVKRADAPKVLEFSWGAQDIRWELEPLGGGGTRLTLWHNIDRGFISMGAAGWHICFDVLDRLLAGQPHGRIAGTDAMKFGGWQRLNAEYAKQFGVPPPGWPTNAPKR